MDYVNACLEEYCLNTASKYPIAERAGKFFANVDGEMRLLDKSYPNATLGEDICMYYVYPLYQLDEYDGITCKKGYRYLEKGREIIMKQPKKLTRRQKEDLKKYDRNRWM